MNLRATEEQAQCSKRVYWGTWGRSNPCSRKAVRDGFCAQHHPDATATRRATSERKYHEHVARMPESQLASALDKIARLQAELDGRGEEIMVREGIVRHKNASHAACVVLDRDERADDEDEIAELFCGTDLTALDGHRVAVIVRDLGKP